MAFQYQLFQHSNKISTSNLTLGFRMSKIKSAKSALPSSKNKLEKKHLFRNNDKMKTSWNQNKLLFYSDFSTLNFYNNFLNE